MGRAQVYPMEGNKRKCPVESCQEVFPHTNPNLHMQSFHPEWWEDYTNGIKARKLQRQNNKLKKQIDTSVDNSSGNSFIVGRTLDIETNAPTASISADAMKLGDVENNSLDRTIPVIESGKLCQTYPKRCVDNFQPAGFIPTLTPTLDDMKSLGMIKYVKTIVEKKERIHEKSGLVRIRPPPEYIARASGYEDINDWDVKPKVMRIKRIGTKAYQLKPYDYHKYLSIGEYKRMTELWLPSPHPHLNQESLIWDEDRLMLQNSLYGSDVGNGTTLFDDDAFWNLGRLDSILQHAHPHLGVSEMKGITSSYTYYGSWGSLFCLHTEDMNTLSCNYLHPVPNTHNKVWYTHKPKDTAKLKIALKSIFPYEYEESDCQFAFRHKLFFPHPLRLMDEDIEYDKESLKKKPENCKKGCYYNDSKQNLKWSMEDFEATMFEEAGELSDSEDEDVFEKPSKRKSKAEAKSGKTCIKY